MKNRLQKCLLLAGILILTSSANVTANPIQFQILGNYDHKNVYDGTSWTYNIPIVPVTWNGTIIFDDTVSGTNEASGPDFLIRDTYFSGPISVPVSPLTASIMAMNPGSYIASSSSAYGEQAFFSSLPRGDMRFLVGTSSDGSDLDPDPNITKYYYYSRWIGPEVVGPSSGILDFPDVSYFTSGSLQQFLQNALLNSYPVWNAEYIGIYSLNVATGVGTWETALQYAGSGTLLGVEIIPEPSSLFLLGTGLGGLALAAWRRKK